MENERSSAYKVLGAAFLWGAIETIHALKTGQKTIKEILDAHSGSYLTADRVVFVLIRLSSAGVVEKTNDKEPSYSLTPRGRLLLDFVEKIEEEHFKELHEKSVKTADEAFPDA